MWGKDTTQSIYILDMYRFSLAGAAFLFKLPPLVAGRSTGRLSSLQQYQGGEQTSVFTPVALLSMATILWTIAFRHVEARALQEAWLLNSTSSLDINWLCMNIHKTPATSWQLQGSQSIPIQQQGVCASSISQARCIIQYLLGQNSLSWLHIVRRPSIG